MASYDVCNRDNQHRYGVDDIIASSSDVMTKTLLNKNINDCLQHTVCLLVFISYYQLHGLLNILVGIL